VGLFGEGAVCQFVCFVYSNTSFPLSALLVHMHEQLAQNHYITAAWPAVKPACFDHKLDALTTLRHHITKLNSH